MLIKRIRKFVVRCNLNILLLFSFITFWFDFYVMWWQMAQKRCEVCGGSGLVLRDKYYFRCPGCGMILFLVAVFCLRATLLFIHIYYIHFALTDVTCVV
jgi:hypothetical protein